MISIANLLQPEATMSKQISRRGKVLGAIILMCATPLLFAQQRGGGGGGGFGGGGNGNTGRGGTGSSASTTARTYPNNGTIGDAYFSIDPETRRVVYIADEATAR